MKQCPVCKTTYPDETLKFCLADGTTLLPVRDEQETIQMSAERNPMRIDFQQDTARMNVAPATTAATAPDQTAKKGCSPLLIGGLIVLVPILLIAAGAAAYFFTSLSGKGTVDTLANTTPNIAAPTPKAVPSADDINAKIAELERKLQEQQKKSGANSQPAPSRTVALPPPSTPTNYNPETASVAPTADGFLSLRTEPSIKTGVQLVKIPTGASVNYIGKCQNPGKAVDGRAGRWCLVSYNNQTGWVFDAYLIR